MTWLESHQTIRDHPKKDHLAELLFNGSTPNDVADYAAAGVLHYLWYWALDFAQDGDLSKFSDRQLAKGCRWQGDPATLVQALTVAGFIDEDRRIHDWDEYAGRLIQRREQDRDRKAAWRVQVKGRGQDADALRDGARTNQPTFKRKSNSKRPVDNSTIRPLAVQEPVCWRCGHTITGDEILDDACVLSHRGTRHKQCATP